MNTYAVRCAGAIESVTQVRATSVHFAVKQAIAPDASERRNVPKLRRGEVVLIRVERL